MGHGIRDDAVASHEYFGDKVRADLRLMTGWKEGSVYFYFYFFLNNLFYESC